MKAILVAAALAVTGAQADAAIYELSFTPDRLLSSGIGPLTFFLDLPSFANLNIRSSGWDLFPPEVVAVGRLGHFEYETGPAGGYFSFTTDPIGNLLSVDYGWGYGDAGAMYWLTGYSWYDWPDLEPDSYFYEESGGSWSWSLLSSDAPSAVPLPATAPMLLTGAALLFALRRLRT
jgi:hypothetical protein